MMQRTSPTFSFEFFPPKNERQAVSFLNNATKLAATGPAFMTVTYGAGGTTREGTIDAVRSLYKTTNVPTAAHLTYINCTISEMDNIADQLWSEGIRHIVALRGDMPADLSWPLDPDADYYQFTSDFVAGLKKRHNFEISVGAYPEKHPDSPSVMADVIALKKKADAGATRAITQFFFDNNVYYDFCDLAAKEKINIPIVPGILPIINYKRMLSFAAICHASVPDWLRDKCDPYIEKPEELQKIAEDILITQINDLVKNGVPHIHFYTLNKTEICLAAANCLNIV